MSFSEKMKCQQNVVNEEFYGGLKYVCILRGIWVVLQSMVNIRKENLPLKRLSG